MTENNRPHAAPDGNVLGVVEPVGMAISASFANVKGRVAIVASPARLAIFHPLHPHLVTVGLGDKNIRMTFPATKHFGMDFMAEGDSADIFGQNIQFDSIAMTGDAVVTDTKSSVTVMTGPTRRAGLHLLHANLIAIGFGLEHVRMTLPTAETIGVHLMTKGNLSHRTLDGNIFRTLMTTATITLDTEGAISVVTGPTGRASLHLLHSHFIAIGLGLKYVRMAFPATEHFSVDFVAEKDSSDRTLNLYFFRILEIIAMASYAVSRNVKSCTTIMTDAA
jgi:hypothetical protein